MGVCSHGGRMVPAPGKMLDLREELLAVREGRLEGAKEYTVNEVAAMMHQAVEDHKPF